VTDRDDQIGCVDGVMNVVTLGQCGGAHVEIGAAGHRALPHLRGEERNAGPPHEACDAVGRARPAGRSAHHHQRVLRGQNHLSGAVERGAMGDRDLDRMNRDHRDIRHFIARDVLGQFEMHRPRPLLHRHTKRVADHGRDAGGADDLPRQFRQRLHGGDHIDDLKTRLPAAHDRLLAGDQNHRHRAKMRVRRAGRQIERARAERRQTNSGLAGQPPVRRGHEGGGLLVAGQDQFDFGGAKRFHQIEILLAGHAEDAVDTFVLQRRDKQVGSFCFAFLLTHVASPSQCRLPCPTAAGAW
jgi:hypothetical protein